MFVGGGGGASGGCETKARWVERERESYLGEQQRLCVAMSNIGVMAGRVLTV